MVSIKFASLITTALAVIVVHSSFTNAAPIVHPGVHRALRKQSTVNLILTMKDTTENTLNSITEADFDSRGDRIAALVESLENHATSAQANVNTILAQEAETAEPLFTRTQSFWLTNQVLVEGASVELLYKLVAEPSIYEIREEIVLPLPTVVPVEGDGEEEEGAAINTTTRVLADVVPEWGVTIVKAPEVWAMGYTGQNVVVGSIDTGVRSTHEAITGNFRSSYGWYDPESKTATPYDIAGHGTHTIGSTVGKNGIGVAPDATWTACKGCRSTGCREADFLACAEFMTCPTDTSGNNKDCSKAPHLVNNSWGGGQGYTFFQAAVDAWIAAGIVPIFAIGNEGPACGTAKSPGDYANVIAVGGTSSDDSLGAYSNKGPSVNGIVKPDISAPGTSVRSSWYSGNARYSVQTGTSMAAPHVSGVIALLLSKDATLTYSEIQSAIYYTADIATIAPTGYTCGNTSDATLPNNQFGYGRINALNAINKI